MAPPLYIALRIASLCGLSQNDQKVGIGAGRETEDRGELWKITDTAWLDETREESRKTSARAEDSWMG
jgi:hypothetical protein